MKRRMPEAKEIKSETDPMLIDDLLMKLQVGSEFIGDLIAVSERINEDAKYENPPLHAALHNRDLFYTDLA